MTTVEYVELTIDEVRKLEPIPSGFRTERVLHLFTGGTGTQVTWGLEERQLPRPYYKTYDDGVVDGWLELYRETVPVDQIRWLTARRGGRCFGLLASSDLRWNSTTWIMDIRVAETARRCGIGSGLLTAAVDIARRQGSRGMTVETQTNNYPAIRFYLRHGFRIAGLNEALYSNQDVERNDVAVFLFRPLV